MRTVHPAPYISRLLEEVKSGDTEHAHCEGDGILCELLTELGYADVVEVYMKVPKWYA